MALTNTQIETNINNAINHGETESFYLAGRVATLESNILASAVGNQFANLAAAAKRWRQQSGVGVSQGAIIPMFQTQMVEIAEYLNIPTSTPAEELLYLWRDDMITNSRTVKARNVTLGSPSAGGSNVGTGELIRLTKDDNDQNIESINIESQKLKIIADQSSPNAEGRHNEQGEFSGSTNPFDFWAASQRTTSGLTSQLKVSSESDSILVNPSFDNFIPFESPFVGPLTALDGWTIASGGFTGLSIDTVNYFTSNPGSPKPASLKFSATKTISQKILANNRLQERVPYIPIVYYNREFGSFSGTLTVHWGSKSQALVLSAQTGWNRFPIVLDKKLYPKNWKSDQPDFKIEVTRTSGDLLIDKVIFKPMFNFNGTWFILLGGVTPFVIGDLFTWSNALVGSDSIVQKWFAILTRLSLPHNNSGSHTWLEPTVVP